MRYFSQVATWSCGGLGFGFVNKESVMLLLVPFKSNCPVCLYMLKALAKPGIPTLRGHLYFIDAWLLGKKKKLLKRKILQYIVNIRSISAKVVLEKHC